MMNNPSNPDLEARRSGFDNAIRSAMNFVGRPKPWTWDSLVSYYDHYYYYYWYCKYHYYYHPRVSSSFDMDFSICNVALWFCKEKVLPARGSLWPWQNHQLIETTSLLNWKVCKNRTHTYAKCIYNYHAYIRITHQPKWFGWKKTSTHTTS